MNIVIVAEKHYRRLFEDCLRNENHNLLGYETEMKVDAKAKTMTFLQI